MLRVIIIEDEVRICQLITSLIDWEGLSMELLCECYDGITALEQIQEKRPDIVITDIRLPGLSGIDLIQQASAFEQSPRFIIISGYKDFEYVRAALRYNVEDYLLKPINQEEINRVLRKAALELLEDRARDQRRDEYELRIMNSNKKIRSQLASDLILDKYSGTSLEEFEEHYHLHDPNRSCVVAIARVFDKMDYRARYASVMKSLRNEMQEQPYCCSAAEYENDLIIILNTDDHTALLLEKLSNLIQRQLFAYDHLTYTLGLSDEICDLTCLTKAYKQACYAINGVYEYPGQSIIRYSDVPKDISFADSLFGSQSLSAIDRAVEQLEADAVPALVGNLFDRISSQKGFGFGAIDYAHGIINLFCSRGRKLTTDAQEILQIQDENLRHLRYCADLKSLQSVTIETCAAMLEKLRDQQSNRESTCIQSARQYISRHYSERISLESVAAIVFLSPSYFSLLFKKETGMTFTDYLTSVRMNRARELLTDVRYSISEIALQLGYKDAKHFSKLFLKTFGIRPNEYRKLYGQSILMDNGG